MGSGVWKMGATILVLSDFQPDRKRVVDAYKFCGLEIALHSYGFRGVLKVQVVARLRLSKMPVQFSGKTIDL